MTHQNHPKKSIPGTAPRKKIDCKFKIEKMDKKRRQKVIET